MTEAVTYHDTDLSDEWWLIIARRMTKAMRAEGVIPPERPEPTGVERAVFACVGAVAPAYAIGMAVYYQPEGMECLFLDLLYVQPRFRRAGVALELIDRCVKAAVRDKRPCVELGVMMHNAPMLALTEKCGFGNGRVYFTRAVAPVGGAQ